MTFNLLWRDDARAYLLSDTAESFRSNLLFPVSSFGEYANAGDGSPQEAAMKIVQVGSHGIVTASGDGRVARAMMDALHRLPPRDLEDGVANALKLAAQAVEPVVGAVGGAQWLCAEWRGENLRTFCWRGHIVEESVNQPVLIAGSPSNEIAGGFATVATEVCQGIAAHRSRGAVLPPTAELAVLAGVVQAMVGAEAMMAYRGIGGAVIGAVVGAEGVVWQPDTIYLLATKDLVNHCSSKATGDVSLESVNSGVVALAVREGCLFVRSSVTGSAKVLVPGHEKARYATWRERWEEVMRRPQHWADVSTVSVVNPVQRSATVALGDFTAPNDLLGLTCEAGNGNLAASLGPTLQTCLGDTSGPGAPWRVNVRASHPFSLPSAAVVPDE
jgi:hypothetical protein